MNVDIASVFNNPDSASKSDDRQVHESDIEEPPGESQSLIQSTCVQMDGSV